MPTLIFIYTRQYILNHITSELDKELTHVVHGSHALGRLPRLLTLLILCLYLGLWWNLVYLIGQSKCSIGPLYRAGINLTNSAQARGRLLTHSQRARVSKPNWCSRKNCQKRQKTQYQNTITGKKKRLKCLMNFFKVSITEGSQNHRPCLQLVF